MPSFSSMCWHDMTSLTHMCWHTYCWYMYVLTWHHTHVMAWQHSHICAGMASLTCMCCQAETMIAPADLSAQQHGQRSLQPSLFSFSLLFFQPQLPDIVSLSFQKLWIKPTPQSYLLPHPSSSFTLVMLLWCSYVFLFFILSPNTIILRASSIPKR